MGVWVITTCHCHHPLPPSRFAHHSVEIRLHDNTRGCEGQFPPWRISATCFFFEAQEIFHKTQLRIQDFFGWKILANGYSTMGLWEFIRSSFSSYTPGTLNSHETLESLKWDAGAERLGMLHLAGWQVPFETGKYRTSPQALSNILHPSWIEDIQ